MVLGFNATRYMWYMTAHCVHHKIFIALYAGLTKCTLYTVKKTLQTPCILIICMLNVKNYTAYLLTENIYYIAHFTVALPTSHCTQHNVYSTHNTTLTNCTLYTSNKMLQTVQCTYNLHPVHRIQRLTNCTLYCKLYTQTWKNQRFNTGCMIIVSRLWHDTIWIGCI